MAAANPKKQCLFFLKGHCRAGAQCPFEHSRGLPPAASIQEQCRYHKSAGGCVEGSMCPYLHGAQDRRWHPAAPLSVPTPAAAPVAHAAVTWAAPAALAPAGTIHAGSVRPGQSSAAQPPPSPPSSSSAAAMDAAWDFRGAGVVDDDDDDGAYFYGVGAVGRAPRAPGEGPAPVDWSHGGAVGRAASSVQAARWAAVASLGDGGVGDGGLGLGGEASGGDGRAEKLQTSRAAAAAVQPPCRFYGAPGGCRFGDSCLYRHDEVPPDGGVVASAASRSAKAEQPLATAPATPFAARAAAAAPAAAGAAGAAGAIGNTGAAGTAEAAADPDEDTECGICFSEVVGGFGLLDGCGHAFCLGCIRGWREKGLAASDAQTVRKCPVCRVPCYLVVPSPRLPASAAEKAAVVGAYTARLRAIPCRHFNQGRGTCPFGTSCLYDHRLPDGRPAPVPAPRLRVDADGNTAAASVVQLAHFLDHSARF